MSDAQGQSLLNFLDAPVLVGDPEGRVIFANDAFVRDFCTDDVSPTGEPLASLFAGGGREAVLASVAEVCSKGKSVHFRLREAGKGYLALASPIHSEESRVGVVILLTDEPTIDGRLLDFHREIQEPLDETTTCLEELLEATGGRRDEHFRELVEQGTVALTRARKWSEQLQGLICGTGGSKSSHATLVPGRVLRQVESRLAPEFAKAQVELMLLISPRTSEAKGDGTMLETALVRLLRLRLGDAPAGSSISMLARDVGSDDDRCVLISVVDPDRDSEGNSVAFADVGEQARLVPEIVSSLGGQITTVVEPPAGRATVIQLALAES
jgi:hypothetical protein